MTHTDALLTREEAQEIAKQATGEKLRDHEWITDEQEEGLVLGTSERDGKYTFRLYVAGKTPQDAVVLVSTTVDRRTGEVQADVFLPRKQMDDHSLISTSTS